MSHIGEGNVQTGGNNPELPICQPVIPHLSFFGRSQVGASLSPQAGSDRTRGHSPRMHQGRLRLNVTRNLIIKNC